MAEHQSKAEAEMSIVPDPTVFPLAETLDHDALRELSEFLTANRGAVVTIDGTAAGQVGAQAAQILAVAGQTWAADRVSFAIDDPSGTVARSLSRLGLSDILSNTHGTEGAAA